MKPFDRKLTRRTFFQKAGILASARLLGSAHAEAPSPQRRALALIGDRYHNSDYIRISLDRVFKELKIPIDYTIQYDRISRTLLQNYQLFLCLRDGMVWPGGYLGPDAYTDYEANLENAKDFAPATPETWITEEQGTAIKDFVNDGNGFYALHNSSHISLSSKNYREVMGGAYVGHPPLRPFRVRPSENEHPITRGIHEFMVNDEQHFVDYDKDRKHILLEAENIDGLTYETFGAKSISGWAYEFGQGRVVFTAVGHTVHAMWAPEYIEIQKRSVQWLLKQL